MKKTPVAGMQHVHSCGFESKCAEQPVVHRNSIGSFLRAAWLIPITVILSGSPLPMRALTTPATGAIAAGYVHTVALKADGTVWAWGLNESGQLGNGTFEANTAPNQLNGMTGVVAIGAGYSHSIALKSDGTVWTWGANSSGQLGDTSTTTRTAPVQVASLNNVIAVGAGASHTLAIKS